MSDERTFSQDEVNAIVSDRLKQERTKIMREVTQREAELTRREAMLTAKAEWQKRGLPADLLDTIDMSKEGAIDSAAAILENIKTTAHLGESKTGKFGFGSIPQHAAEADPDFALRSAMGLHGKR